MPTIIGNTSGTPKPRTFDANNPNIVALDRHGPRRATVLKFSSVFYQINTTPDASIPTWKDCDQQTEGSIQRIRVYVRFNGLLNRDKKPLDLSKPLSVFWGDKAEWAVFVAAALNIDVAAVKALKTTLDIETLIGKPIMATTKASSYNTALLHKFQPIPLDDTAPAPVTSNPQSATPTRVLHVVRDEEDEADLQPPGFEDVA